MNFVDVTMPSLTAQLFGSSLSTAADASPAPTSSPFTISSAFGKVSGTTAAAAAAKPPSAGKKQPAGGKHSKGIPTLSTSSAAAATDDAHDDAAPAASVKAGGLAGFAAVVAQPSSSAADDLFRKIAPAPKTAAPAGAGRRVAAKAAATGAVVEEEKKRKKHLSHLHDDMDPKELQRTVFISNVPNSTNVRNDLTRHFRECGEIESVRVRCLRLAKQTGETKSRGRGVRVLRHEFDTDDRVSAVAYIVFVRPSSVELALAMSGTVFKGRHLTVAREEKESKAFLPKFSVFLGNLAHDVADEEVWNYFLERNIKDVDRVRIIRDRDTGLAKGIGYVGFRSSASVKRAIEVREQDLHGRPLRVCHVQKPKDPKLQITSATRREMRRLKHQKAIMDNGPEVLAGKKLTKKAKAAAARGGEDQQKTSGRREEAANVGMKEVPSWMGTTTNPRKKLPAELRALTQTREDRRKAITEKRKAEKERIREKRKENAKRAK